MTQKPKRGAKKKNNASDPRVFVLIGGGAGIIVLSIAFFIVFQQSPAPVITSTGVTAIAPESTLPPAQALENLPPYERGLILAGSGRFLEAAAAFTAVLDGNPSDDDALLRRADAYRNVGDFDAAIADYNRLLDRDPQPESGIWFNLALAYYERYQRTGEPVDLPDALAATREAIRIAANIEGEVPPRYHQLAGDTLYAMGDQQAALAEYEAYMSMIPEPSDAVTRRIQEITGSS
jgi:tetratricopeptide (TPR) repeat protein